MTLDALLSRSRDASNPDLAERRVGVRRWMISLGLMTSLIACAGYTGIPPSGDNAYCARLFNQFDAIEFFPQPASPPGFNFRQMQLSGIRQAQCLTMTRNLVAMGAAEQSGRSRAPAGPPLRWPVAVQVGVVTNMEDDARARAFFTSLGYRSRSVGWPNLGIRIYVEARTVGEIQDIMATATRAGFIGPYPSRFVTF